MNAIQTVYKGYRFRSRLEARYAVLFDMLGVAWRYEPEGFDLGAEGWYLPDFWLETVQMWAEVKPGKFTPDEWAKCKALALQSGHPCIMLAGDPEYHPYLGFDPRLEDLLVTDWLIDSDYLDEHRFFGGAGGGHDFQPNTETKRAYLAARQARFEHGEMPMVPDDANSLVGDRQYKPLELPRTRPQIERKLPSPDELATQRQEAFAKLERYLLGYMLVHPEACEAVFAILSSQDFTEEADISHQGIAIFLREYGAQAWIDAERDLDWTQALLSEMSAMPATDPKDILHAAKEMAYRIKGQRINEEITRLSLVRQEAVARDDMQTVQKCRILMSDLTIQRAMLDKQKRGGK